MIPPPPRPTLFPYTTLFRSQQTRLALEATPASTDLLMGLPAFWADDLGHRGSAMAQVIDRKSTRLNSSHANISYAVFCLKKQRASGWCSAPQSHAWRPRRCD